MSVKAQYIPRSEKGREVSRYLRAQGFHAKNKHILGMYLCQLALSDELTNEQLRDLAYIFNPEEAAHDEEGAALHAERIREDGHHLGMTPEETEATARRAETAWLHPYTYQRAEQAMILILEMPIPRTIGPHRTHTIPGTVQLATQHGQYFKRSLRREGLPTTRAWEPISSTEADSITRQYNHLQRDPT